MNETPFKDPKNTSALVKDNGLPYEQFREVVNFQHPGGTLEGNGKKSKQLGEPDNETTNETLVNLQNERTIETPYANKLKNRIIITQLSIDTKFRKRLF